MHPGSSQSAIFWQWWRQATDPKHLRWRSRAYLTEAQSGNTPRTAITATAKPRADTEARSSALNAMPPIATEHSQQREFFPVHSYLADGRAVQWHPPALPRSYYWQGPSESQQVLAVDGEDSVSWSASTALRARTAHLDESSWLRAWTRTETQVKLAGSTLAVWLPQHGLESHRPQFLLHTLIWQGCTVTMGLNQAAVFSADSGDIGL